MCALASAAVRRSRPVVQAQQTAAARRRSISRPSCRSMPPSGPGTLPNGRKYYIRQNGRPEKARLAAAGGQESGRSKRPTISRASRTSSSTWRSTAAPTSSRASWSATSSDVGARLGPHVNAYTSFDETVYMLDLPTDQGDVVATRSVGAVGFRRRTDPRPGRDRQGARRRHRGVARRPRGRLTGSRQADPDHLLQLAVRRPPPDRQARHSSSGSSRRACAPIYDTWYRPERQAVIAVGDIDPQRDRSRHQFDVQSAARPRAPPRRCRTAR